MDNQNETKVESTNDATNRKFKKFCISGLKFILYLFSLLVDNVWMRRLVSVVLAIAIYRNLLGQLLVRYLGEELVKVTSPVLSIVVLVALGYLLGEFLNLARIYNDEWIEALDTKLKGMEAADSLGDW